MDNYINCNYTKKKIITVTRCSIENATGILYQNLKRIPPKKKVNDALLWLCCLHV